MNHVNKTAHLAERLMALVGSMHYHLNGIGATTPLVASLVNNVITELDQTVNQLQSVYDHDVLDILQGRTEIAYLMKKLSNVDLAYPKPERLKVEDDAELHAALVKAHQYREWSQLVAYRIDKENVPKVHSQEVLHEYYSVTTSVTVDSHGALHRRANAEYIPMQLEFTLPSTHHYLDEFYIDPYEFIDEYLPDAQREAASLTLPDFPEDISYEVDVETLRLVYAEEKLAFKVQFKSYSIASEGEVTLMSAPGAIYVEAFDQLGYSRSGCYWTSGAHQYTKWDDVPYFFREAILEQLQQKREEILQRYTDRIARWTRFNNPTPDSQ